MIILSKRKTMDDRKKQIAESIADACVSSFIGSTFPGCTISNLKVRVVSVRRTPNGDESREAYKPNPSRETYKPNPSRPTQRNLEDGVKPPLVLTKEFSGLQPRQAGKPRKDVAAERWNRFALWREAWRNLWRDACW